MSNLRLDEVYHNPPPPEIEQGRVGKEQRASREEEQPLTEEEDGPWYPGRARDEYNKRMFGQKGDFLDHDDDPVQVRYTAITYASLSHHAL